MGQFLLRRFAEPVSMGVSRTDWAVEPGGRRGSMPHEHTTSRLPCEIARDEPAAGPRPGQTWTAQRLAATSNSFDKNAVTYVPFARAVVAVRNSRLDGQIEREELYLPVKEPTSWDCLRAHKRYRAALAYVAATFIGTFFL